jgi:transcriptional regulator with XRE-family HTH domain
VKIFSRENFAYHKVSVVFWQFDKHDRPALRHAKGLSQDDLAYEAEVSRSYLSQLEKGAFYASLKIVGKLAMALDVEPAELIEDAKENSASLETDRQSALIIDLQRK